MIKFRATHERAISEDFGRLFVDSCHARDVGMQEMSLQMTKSVTPARRYKGPITG